MKKFLRSVLTYGFLMLTITLAFVQCTKNDTTTITLPTLTTSPILFSPSAPFYAASGGNITVNGGATITAYGICYSSSNPSPDLTCETTNDVGSATNNYVSAMGDLSPGTTYYVRAYASNSSGTSYGNVLQFTTGNPGWTSVFYTGGTSIKSLSGISFSDDVHGWAFGVDINNRFVLLSSIDSGRVWISNNISTQNYFSSAYNGAYVPTKNNSICFTNSGDGWIAYGGDSVLATQNGGASWILQPYTTAPPVPGSGLNSLCFTSSLTGFVTGLGIYKTSGGTTWTNVAPATIYFNSVYFINQSVGFASTNNNIYKSSDGGNTWANIATTQAPVYGFYFVNGVLFGAGSQSLIKTSDQGATWASINGPAGAIIYNVCFISQTFGVVATQNGLFETYDGGNTWTTINANGPFNTVCRTGQHLFGISGTSIYRL